MLRRGVADSGEDEPPRRQETPTSPELASVGALGRSILWAERATPGAAWSIPEKMNRQDAKDAKFPEPDAELDACAHVVVDAAIEVHRVLGPGFLEAVYEEALCVELGLRGVPFLRQVPMALAYKGVPMVLSYLKAFGNLLGCSSTSTCACFGTESGG
jgi:hypothetical protein